MDVSNLILLCHFCNAQCPETVFADDFMLWLNSRVKKGKNYFIDMENPQRHVIEYENMYGKLSEEMLMWYSSYFGMERLGKCLLKYADKVNNKQAFIR